MKGADELHLEPVFLFRLFWTFTFSCLFSLCLYCFSGLLSEEAFSCRGNTKATMFWGLLLRKLQNAGLEEEL